MRPFSLTGHAECVGLVRDLGLPLLVLGGGGYTVRNVARCWTLETSVLLNTDLPTQLPRHEYWEYFAPDFSLTPELTKRLEVTDCSGRVTVMVLRYENGNSREYLETLIQQTQQMLRVVSHAPSVQMTDTEDSDLDRPRRSHWDKLLDHQLDIKEK